MQAWFDVSWPVILAILLLVINMAGVTLVMCQLPGTWVILLSTTAYAWWSPEGVIGVWTLVALLLLAVTGEILELISSAAGAARAGGTKRGAGLALVGAVVGAVGGSLLMPILGTIAGACLGAGMGSYGGDRWAGRDAKQAALAGREAAKGRLWGTLAKIGIALLMWIVAGVAVIW